MQPLANSKFSHLTQVLSLAAAVCAFALPASAADAPEKAPLTRYAKLWTNSPFTTPKPPEESTPEKDPFEDYALKGIAPLSSGRYLVTLVNKKNPTETTTIDTERSDEYEIVKIDRNPDKALGTVVHLKKGNMRGIVSYDEKISTLKPPVPPKQAQQGHQGQNPSQAPTPPGQATPPAANPNVPQARSRVLPPSNPAPTPNPATNTGGRPQTSGDRRDPRMDRGDRGRGR